MTVKELSDALGYRVLCAPSMDREILGGVACDLLSRAMSHMKAGDAWITVISHVNVVAIATLTDPACIIFSDGIEPEAEVLDRAREHGVNLLSASKDTFSVCAEISAICNLE